MPHKSLLWNKPLTECASIPETIPRRTLDDVILTGDFKGDTLSLLCKPCSAEEIPVRQKMIRYASEKEEFRTILTQIHAEIRELSRLCGFFDRSEIEEERILLFLPVMKRYFALTKTMTALEDYDGRAGEIGACFRKIRENDAFLAAEKRCADILAVRQSGMMLTVSGSNIHAHECTASLKSQLEEIYRRLDMDDAIPTEKHPTRATPSVVMGYTGVYRGFLETARGFYNAYRAGFLEGDGNLRVLFGYESEIAFLLEIGAYFRKLADDGYPLTYPAVSEEREMILSGLVDASLAKRGVNGSGVVPNDVHMEDRGGERLNFYILSGANGGGKTTYLRACTLAALFFVTGCPVAARSGRMMAFDNIFTHFPANESFESDGRFANETARADEITEQATKNSFAVFNETFSGTDEKKSEEYSSRLAHTMANRGTFGIYVTHIHSLTGGDIPTLAAMIDENDENRRTYKIRRVGATASSFAADILEKYGLDAESLAKKIRLTGGDRNV
ncbi:MAG: hypothetical protein IJ037_01370 [Clostridia bacterium]|nr:hypothetical protein [Clostridia bacterium]